MLTVITETTVKAGREADWDVAYHERARDARAQDGWVDLHLLVPVDDRRRRVVVGTWRDRDAWERWHGTETFRRTRERLDDATERHGDERWFEVAEEETREGATARADGGQGADRPRPVRLEPAEQEPGPATES